MCLPLTPPPEDVLDVAIREILMQDSPYAYSTFTTIQRYLRQFGLLPRVETHDILVEAYLRGKAVLRSGVVIRTPHAWLKRTAYNIVREKNRKLASQQPADPEVLDFLGRASYESWLSQETINHRLTVLWEAFETLRQSEPEGAELLELKTIRGLSWLEVQNHLQAQGRDVPNTDVLRQRACRAKKHLRQIFHQVESNA
ncbi:hypothetical protein IQ268_12930 [Oculatella sp. LEGE 06141]|uniref:hypothetical protein n=1 Tax=Oculatella sp. LEGE 06141 TaxID=1828648 RepID=UPI001882722B|nr:hypothetical protein [Oculatella sp. LEGE 06141]MBE9179467.1 hypothetical protein [Oculatella sp. LEGE 06141]